MIDATMNARKPSGWHAVFDLSLSSIDPNLSCSYWSLLPLIKTEARAAVPGTEPSPSAGRTIVRARSMRLGQRAPLNPSAYGLGPLFAT